MDRTKYKRLGCWMPLCEGKHKALGLCSAHYEQHKSKTLFKELASCAHCGRIYLPFNRQSMYCSKACGLDAWKVANLGKGRKRTKSAIEADRREANQASLIASLVASEAAALERIARSWLATPLCSRCGKAFTRTHRYQRYCCAACRNAAHNESRSRWRSSDAYKRSKRAYKAKRRAVIRGASAETIDPIDVFVRDGWICHMCKRKTLRRLRGSYDDRAPEMDHVIPLAAGGTHTRSNVACACRACNLRKGSTPLGQILLDI